MVRSEQRRVGYKTTAQQITGCIEMSAATLHSARLALSLFLSASLVAHRVLTAAAGMAEQRDAATAALFELRRVQPNISLAWIAGQIPTKQDAEREHYLEGSRRAGLD
jgi:hypothetical protein